VRSVDGTPNQKERKKESKSIHFESPKGSGFNINSLNRNDCRTSCWQSESMIFLSKSIHFDSSGGRGFQINSYIYIYAYTDSGTLLRMLHMQNHTECIENQEHTFGEKTKIHLLDTDIQMFCA
jgi:hypothetical protein